MSAGSLARTPSRSLARAVPGYAPLVPANDPTPAQRNSRLLLCSTLAALVAAGCGESELPLRAVERGEATVTGQGVLFVVVDGLRWDHTSLAGYDRDTTPFLKLFAEECALFTNTWAPIPALLGAHVALLSGCDPWLAVPPQADAKRDREFDTWVIPQALPLVARPFLGRAWRTAAFLDHPAIAELRGFDVGFEDFVAYGGRTRVGSQGDDGIGVHGVGLRFIRWMNALELDENWFAYVHLHDLERQWSEGIEPRLAESTRRYTRDWKPREELSFIPPVGLTEPVIDALPASRIGGGEPQSLAHYELRYDRALRALDDALRRLLLHVDDFGRGDDVTVVVVGSFGTELGEHGLYLGAGLAAEEDLRIPLLVRPSRAVQMRHPIKVGTRIDDLVSSLDVSPTLIELLDLPGTAQTHGVSLVPLLTGDSPVERRRRIFAYAAFGGGGAVVGEDWRWFRPQGEAGVSLSFRDPTAETISGLTGTDLAPSLLGRWQSLVLEQRRQLHFGVGGADTKVVESLHTLQDAPLSSIVETPQIDRGGSGEGRIQDPTPHDGVHRD